MDVPAVVALLGEVVVVVRLVAVLVVLGVARAGGEVVGRDGAKRRVLRGRLHHAGLAVGHGLRVEHGHLRDLGEAGEVELGELGLGVDDVAALGQDRQAAHEVGAAANVAAEGVAVLGGGCRGGRGGLGGLSHGGGVDRGDLGQAGHEIGLGLGGRLGRDGLIGDGRGLGLSGGRGLSRETVLGSRLGLGAGGGLEGLALGLHLGDGGVVRGQRLTLVGGPVVEGGHAPLGEVVLGEGIRSSGLGGKVVDRGVGGERVGVVRGSLVVAGGDVGGGVEVALGRDVRVEREVALGLVVGRTDHVHDAEQGGDGGLVVVGALGAGGEARVDRGDAGREERQAGDEADEQQEVAEALGNEAENLEEGADRDGHRAGEAEAVDERLVLADLRAVEQALVGRVVVGDDDDGAVALHHERAAGAVNADDVLAAGARAEVGEVVAAVALEHEQGEGGDGEQHADEADGRVDEAGEEHADEHDDVEPVVRELARGGGVEVLHLDLEPMLLHEGAEHLSCLELLLAVCGCDVDLLVEVVEVGARCWHADTSFVGDRKGVYKYTASKYSPIARKSTHTGLLSGQRARTARAGLLRPAYFRPSSLRLRTRWTTCSRTAMRTTASISETATITAEVPCVLMGRSSVGRPAAWAVSL